MTWTDRIEADLARRITHRQPLPCTLKLQPLADHYGVSTRPVREAMARLRRRGLLTPAKIATLPIADDDTPPPAADAPHPLMATLTQQIIPMSLSAGGQAVFLRESAMAAQHGVSTTVIRELFSQLVGHGLLEHLPRRGWRVRPLTQKDLDDFIHVRQSLEGLALHLAWEKLDLLVIERFLKGNVPPRPGRRAQADNGFHQYLIDAADNRYIRDFFERHGRYFQLLFAWEDQSPATTAQTVAQHQRILKAILARDLPSAEAALRVHILDNHPVLTRLLKRPTSPTRQRT